MNGKELLESMGHVDEKYIAEAEEAPKRRRWQALALSAACLALILVGVRAFLPAQQMEKTATGTMAAAAPRSMEAADSVEDFGAAPMMANALAQMTVRVMEQTEEALICVVVDPGTSSFQPDDQVRIALPDTTPGSSEETEAQQETSIYEVLFLPDQSTDLITPAQWTPMEDSE